MWEASTNFVFDLTSSLSNVLKICVLCVGFLADVRVLAVDGDWNACILLIICRLSIDSANRACRPLLLLVLQVLQLFCCLILCVQRCAHCEYKLKIISCVSSDTLQRWSNPQSIDAYPKSIDCWTATAPCLLLSILPLPIKIFKIHQPSINPQSFSSWSPRRHVEGNN